MKADIAKHLMNIKAVELRPDDPFTWSSGIKSPIYCDNRLTLSFPNIRREVARGLESLVKDQFPEAEVVVGTATAGIPHAAWLSDRLDLPMAYVRSSSKGHGKQNQIEGIVKPGQKVVIVEDLISTGGSVITAAKALRDQGAEVLGVVAIFTYDLETGKQKMAEAELPFVTLTDFQALIDVARKEEQINERDFASLKRWHSNPSSDQWLQG